MINSNLLIPVILSPLLFVGIYLLLGIPENNMFLFTNLLIIFFSFVGMFFKPFRFYTLSSMVFIFIFIFFGLVPLTMDTNNIVIQGNQFDIFDKVKANLIILIGMFFFILGSNYKANSIDRIANSLPDIKRLNIFFIIIFISVSFLILYRWNFDLSSIFFRSRSRDILIDGQSVFNLKLDTNEFPALDYHFFTRIIRPMPILLLVIFFYFYKKNLKFYDFRDRLSNFILLSFLALTALFLNPPTGIDRSQTGILYIPLLIIFTRFWERPFMMQITLLGGVFIAFPILDKFRNFSTWDNFDFKFSFKYLKTAHFDAYQNFVRAIEIDFISYGHQLLGSLLFFVPRALWNAKPVGSGSELATRMDYVFGGIAMPFIGEGYVNFGVIGSCLFMLFLGIVLGNLDRVAWEMKRSNKDNLFIYYYYFLFGLVFFTMRGDLMNSIAFIFATTAAFWGLVCALKFSSRLRLSKN